MAKPVSYARIEVQKTHFDLLHSTSMKSSDVNTVGSAVQRMYELSEKITAAMNQAPLNVAGVRRYFNWGAVPNVADVSVDSQQVQDEVQIKLAEVMSHMESLRTNSSAPSSLQGRVDPVSPPPNPSSTTSATPSATPPANTAQNLLQGSVDPVPPPSIPSSTPSATPPANTAQAAATVPLNPSSALPAAPPARTAQDVATGFRNMASNCWANSLLSLIITVPNFKQAYLTVANHHAQKNVYDPDRPAGEALLNALRAYDTALAQKTAVPPEVSQDVRIAFNHLFGRINPITSHEVFSKNAYTNEDAWEAMQMLMGQFEEIVRERQIPNPIFSSLYCQMQTARHYRPIGEQRDANPARVLRDDYSRLSLDNVSRLTCNDYQILLDLQNKGHLSFPALISDYFRNSSVHGSNTAEYLLPNGKVQSFQLTSEGRKFMTVPDEFMLTIKRFGADARGQGFKITDPVMVQRTISLPSEATHQNTPIAYELDAFIVHDGGTGGGHYICYKKIDGVWIEANDGSVRFVDPGEIDRILHGHRGAYFTSYLHHYTRVPEAAQAIAIAAAQNAPVLPSPAPLLAQAAVAQSAAQKSKCESDLKSLTALSAAFADNTIVAFLQNQPLSELPPESLSTLRHAIWLHGKTPNITDYGTVTLDGNPQLLQQITLPWIIFPKGTTLLDQMISVQNRKIAIAAESLKETQIRAFLHLLNNASIAQEELALAFKALPDQIQWDLHGLIYRAHKIQFGPEHVSKPEYKHKYGEIALETATDLRKTLKEALEAVANTFGDNIVQQLAIEYQIKAERLQYAFERDQLIAFRELLIHSPATDLTPKQLAKAFERFEIREELKEKLRWAIWKGHGSKNVADYGKNMLNQDPRCILWLYEPILSTNPPNSHILDQLIALLDRQSH